MRYIMLIIAVVLMGTLIVNSALGNVVTLFEEDAKPLIDALGGGVVSVDAERADFYYGSTSLKVSVPATLDNGQAFNKAIPGWEYKVVGNPVKSDEVRWVMFTWKKPDGEGIMVQFAQNHGWGVVCPRYVAGKNLAGWYAISVSNYVPRGWQIVIRDLYADFGSFTLTGIALVPFSGVGLFDSIYLAKDKDDLLSVFDPTLDAEVFVSVPSRVSDGTTFTAFIEVQNVYDLAGFEMEVSFNPDVIRVNKIEEGTFLSGDGGTYWLNPDDDNRRGKVTEIACVRTGSNGCSGDGTLFTIKFKARDEGNSDIVLENVRLADSEARIISTRVTNASVVVADVPRWDVNGDGRVDFLDLVIVAQHFGEYINQPSDVNPDVTGDGKVDITDLISVGRHYGDIYGSAAPSKLVYSVPLRFVPSLEKAFDLVRSSPCPDKATIKLLMGLIKNARPIETSTWGKHKTELR